MRRFSIVPVAAVAALMATSGSAGAATTIGETFPPEGSVCGTDNTVLQTGSPNGQYAAPSAGVITSWTFQAGASVPASIKLKVGRSAGGNSFLIVGESPEKNPNVNTPNTYTDVQISVQAGDVIGYWTSGPAAVCGRTGSGYLYRYRGGDQPPGTTEPYGSESSNFQINFSAQLEPDCDKDRLGDETQDTDIASCLPKCKGGTATIVGTDGNDVRKGTSGKDVIVGLGGNDKLSGLAGNDVICGGSGKDTLKGGKGNDKLYGQQGKDALKGGPGKDKLKGGAGKDKQVQ